MVDKKFIVAAIGVIVALGAIGPSLAQMFQQAEAHGVQAQLQSRFVRIDDETWSKTSVKTGDTLSVSGKFVSLVNRDLRGWYTVYGDSPNAGNRWEIVARSEEHTSELQSLAYLVCRLLLEKKKKMN